MTEEKQEEKIKIPIERHPVTTEQLNPVYLYGTVLGLEDKLNELETRISELENFLETKKEVEPQ